MRHLLAAALVALPVAAQAQVAGVWRTETSDDGAYLHVRVGACANDAALTCGTIVKAVNTERTDLVGKPIIWAMAANGENAWAKGRIWAPDDDKTYRSKMALSGDRLKVEGCVAVFCRGQSWSRVE